jgi:hypothetical protein
MRRRGVILALAVLVAALAGCDKLTREHFDQIRVRQDAQADVVRLIGPPDFKLPGQWHYEREDRHLIVRVDFDPAGIVTRKQWVDAMTSTWVDSAAQHAVPDEPAFVHPQRAGADE